MSRRRPLAGWASGSSSTWCKLMPVLPAPEMSATRRWPAWKSAIIFWRILGDSEPVTTATFSLPNCASTMHSGVAGWSARCRGVGAFSQARPEPEVDLARLGSRLQEVRVGEFLLVLVLPAEGEEGGVQVVEDPREGAGLASCSGVGAC